jgi:hypothetical protein
LASVTELLKHKYLKVILAMCAPLAATAQASVCLPDTGKENVDARYDFGVRVSLRDSAAVAERTAFGLPALTEQQVLIVTDSVACETAAKAYYATFGLTANSNDRFVVLQPGNRRIVLLAQQVTHYTAHVVFDDSFATVISTFWH